MQNLGPWLGAAFEDFKNNWAGHIGPCVLFFALSFGITFGAILLLGLFMAVLILGMNALAEAGAIPMDIAGLVMSLGYIGSFSVMFLGIMLFTTPLQVGYQRVVLRMMRGEPYRLTEIYAIDGLKSALVANILVGCICSIGMMFCYFPGLIAAAFFMFTTPLIADRKVSGGIDAMQQSVALARKDTTGLLAYWFVSFFICMAIAYIPIVGMFIFFPLMTTFILTAYLKLSEEGEQPELLEGSPELVEKDLANPYASPRQI